MMLALSSSPQLDAPVVTKAFLKHDMETLHDHCGPEIMQRLEGLCKAFQQQVGGAEGAVEGPPAAGGECSQRGSRSIYITLSSRFLVECRWHSRSSASLFRMARG